MRIDKYSMDGKRTGEIEISDAVFQIEYKNGLIYDILRAEMNNLRQGTASTKTRGMVRGGGAKPWRQKGTGRARQGSTRATQWVGGGVPHGPKPRDYSIRMPRRMKRNAIRAILSKKMRQRAFKVLDELKIPEPKTKHAARILKSFDIYGQRNVFIIEDQAGNHGEREILYKNAVLSIRNIANTSYLYVDKLNGRELYYAGNILISEDTMRRLEEAYK